VSERRDYLYGVLRFLLLYAGWSHSLANGLDELAFRVVE
jgi:hypothetical protein